MIPQWGTVDAEIKVLSVRNPELTDVLPLKPGVGSGPPVRFKRLTNSIKSNISRAQKNPTFTDNSRIYAKQKTTDRRIQMQENQKQSKAPSFTSGIGLANILLGAFVGCQEIRVSDFNLSSLFSFITPAIPFGSVQFQMAFSMRLEVFPTFALQTVPVFD